MTAPPMRNGYMGLSTGVLYLRNPKKAIVDDMYVRLRSVVCRPVINDSIVAASSKAMGANRRPERRRKRR